jgi:hypothetical protein
VFRDAVRFDLGQFDSVVSAELLFDSVGSVNRSGGETVGQSPPASFATTLGVATDDFSPGLPFDDDASLPTGDSAISMEVASQMRSWLNNERPNFGFVVTGPRGLVDPNNPPKDTDAKVSWYGNFRLRVTYNPAQNSRAPQ